MSARARRLPRVLLIGAGRFGQQHLKEWLALQAEGRVRLAGVLVRGEASAQALREQQPALTVWTDRALALGSGVDLVDIVTPTASHAALVRACLPQADVLCEKPLGTDPATVRSLFAMARRAGRMLMAGHNYLHHPVVQAALAHVAEQGPPTGLRLVLSNPVAEAPDTPDPLAEWCHAFYLVQACGAGALRSMSAWQDGPQAQVNLALDGGCQAQLSVGWQGALRQRSLELQWPDHTLKADLDDGQLLWQWRGRSERQLLGRAQASLRAQMLACLAQRPQGTDPAHADSVITSTRWLARARAAAEPRPRRVGARRDRPRVLVVGGGVFGSTCAIELARDNEVVLAERHGQLLTEASWLNQWRHHSGFHYPRSLDTIEEVRACKADFESVYEGVIDRSVSAYYAVSALGREITRARYLAVCDANHLNYRIVEPPPEIVHPERLAVCLHTDEAVVRIDKLQAQLLRRMNASRHLDLRMGTTVTGGRLLSDGTKQVRLKGPSGTVNERFDVVVNATYAGTNEIARWFGFPVRPMRFDLLEMALFEIPKASRFMMTILDGPFTSLTHTGQGDRFMLSHIHQSILASQVTPDGRPPAWGAPRSNRESLLAHGLRYLPILERARFVESRIGVRTVEAYSEDFDGRPTVVTAHGFGCWSVLGGKIITAVSNAREIVQAVARQTG